MKSTYYDILEVSPQAEDIVIRAAYRALAQRYHPDKSSEPKESAELRMRAIQEIEPQAKLTDSRKTNLH